MKFTTYALALLIASADAFAPSAKKAMLTRSRSLSASSGRSAALKMSSVDDDVAALRAAAAKAREEAEKLSQVCAPNLMTLSANTSGSVHVLPGIHYVCC